MTKESRWRKILWVEHRPVGLGDVDAAGNRAGDYCAGERIGQPVAPPRTDSPHGDADGSAGGNSHRRSGMVLAKCHGEWRGGAWHGTGEHGTTVQRGAGPRGIAHRFVLGTSSWLE